MPGAQADLPGGMSISYARVHSSTQIRFRIRNNTGAAIDPPSVVYNFKVIR